MSAVLQATDPTRGHSLVSTRSQTLEQIRHLFFSGNLMDPDRLFQSQHLRHTGGGEEVQAHCLRRSIGGFIQRGRITPMETWAEPMPPVLIGEGAERDTVRIEGPMTSEGLGFAAKRPGGLAGVGAAMAYVKFYPGDEILAVLRANEGKGIVEISALAGYPWYADEAEMEIGVPQILNADFFPDRLPVTLSGLKELIYRKESASELHSAVARDFVASCDQFERYAMARLSAEHVLLRQRTSPNGQFVYTYTPVARELLKQLEMKPQDSILESMGGISAEQLQQIVSSVGVQGQVDPAMIGQIAGAVATQILAAQKAQEEEPKTKGKRKESDAVVQDERSGTN